MVATEPSHIGLSIATHTMERLLKLLFRYEQFPDAGFLSLKSNRVELGMVCHDVERLVLPLIAHASGVLNHEVVNILLGDSWKNFVNTWRELEHDVEIRDNHVTRSYLRVFVEFELLPRFE